MQLSFPGMPEPDPPKPKRKFRIQPQPVCPVHGVPMLAGSTTETVRYCYCPVAGCGQSAKQSRVFRDEFESRFGNSEGETEGSERQFDDSQTSLQASVKAELALA